MANISTPKWRNWMERNGPKQYQIPARQTLNSVTPCLAPRASHGKIWAPKGLADCTPTALLAVVLMASLGVAPLTACGIPQETFHIPEFSYFMGSPLHFWLHSQSFMPCPLRGTLPELSVFLLKSGWNPAWPPWLLFCMPEKLAPHGLHHSQSYQ